MARRIVGKAANEALRGLEYAKDDVQRPRYFGLLTNDIVYDRLAPGEQDTGTGL